MEKIHGKLGWCSIRFSVILVRNGRILAVQLFRLAFFNNMVILISVHCQGLKVSLVLYFSIDARCCDSFRPKREGLPSSQTQTLATKHDINVWLSDLGMQVSHIYIYRII